MRYHLFVIAARKEGPPRQVLVVCISSIGNAYSDLTVIVQAGEHPFIQHESYVRYTDARIMEEGAIIRGIENGTCPQREDCTAAFLSRVVGGFTESPAVKPFAVEFIKESD